MKRIIGFLALCLAVAAGAETVSAHDGDRILGVYRVVGESTGEESKVRISKSGNIYEAHIIWLERPLDAEGNPRYDVLNPDASLRSVRGDRVQIIRNLKYDSKNGVWTGGTIYNPISGKTYDVMAEFESPGVLRVRGYMGRPVLGKNYMWTKLE